MIQTPDTIAAAAQAIQASDSLAKVATAIQFALAPVFLLTGIAGVLNVMTGRLSRIIDRGRALSADGGGGMATESGSVQLELQRLERRRNFVSIGITACTIAALLVCMVIATLFLDAVVESPLERLIGPLFIASMVALVVGLSYFLREVHMAMVTIHIHNPKERDEDTST